MLYKALSHGRFSATPKALKTFTTTKPQVSSHYVIADDGKVVQMVNDYLRAWHGGNSSWGKNSDINSASIGIELDNNGFEPFSDQQIISLLALLTKLKKDYNIPTQNIIGHSDNSGRHERNLALSAVRAETVRGLLVDLGATLPLSVDGIGASRPPDPAAYDNRFNLSVSFAARITASTSAGELN